MRVLVTCFNSKWKHRPGRIDIVDICANSILQSILQGGTGPSPVAFETSFANCQLFRTPTLQDSPLCQRHLRSRRRGRPTFSGQSHDSSTTQECKPTQLELDRLQFGEFATVNTYLQKPSESVFYSRAYSITNACRTPCVRKEQSTTSAKSHLSER